MYKIFIDVEEDKKELGLRQLGIALKAELIKNDNSIVYDNFSNNNVSANDLELNLFIRLQGTTNNENGLEVIIDENSKLSNGFGKELYRGLQKMHYNKDINKGVIYRNNVSNILKDENVPIVLVGIINFNDRNQVEWLNNNIETLAETMNIAIVNAFNLIPC